MLPISPLRYPGSKRRLAPYIERVLSRNHLRPALYVEPFVGGGSVALHLLQQGLVDRTILIDRDPWVASFWQTVFRDTDWLVNQIENAQVTLDTWRHLKRGQPAKRRERAWTCLFLNRTSFSGILEDGAGPLGGVDQQSQYPIDCRFPRTTLIARIQEIAQFRDNVAGIWCCSWKEGMARIRRGQADGRFPRERLFYYFDPPFFDKADGLYRFCFADSDHRSLRDALLALQDSWVLSYDSAEQVRALYGIVPGGTPNGNGTKNHQVEFHYSVSMLQEPKKGKEVILSNMEVLPEFG